ncbi:P-loop containing nucleoside triphosphate hydrolase protein [Marasmius fiardii PR-910]|nr:P-loop containing nucleoside triphosphate hydrolase protein [Marasmius fiardii PR-910]
MPGLLFNPRFCFDFIEGRCRYGEGCRHRHDIRRCECGLILPCSDYASHSGGKRHREAIAGRGLRPRRRPAARVSGQNGNSPSSSHYYDESDLDARPEQGHFSGAARVPRCPKCSRFVQAELYEDHVKSHDTQSELEVARKAVEANKNGITVSGLDGVNFGVVAGPEEGSEEEQEPLVLKIEIKRECELPASPLRLVKCKILSSERGDEVGVRFSANFKGSPFINPPRTRILHVKFHPSYAGLYKDTLELVFFDIHSRTRFVIHRRLSATVGDRADHEAILASVTPYRRRKRGIPLRLDGPIKTSTRPATWTKTEWKSFLPKFEVPKKLTDILYKSGGVPRTKKETFETLKTLVSPTFNTRTYGATFQLMLHLEEEQMKFELDAYAMEGVTLQPDHPRYRLEVKGLSEGRPSVLVGDFILVRQKNATDKTWFEGRVHQVHESHVSLRFGDNFSTYRGTSFDVRFVLNRLSFRRMHAAVTNNNNPERLLFPGPAHLRQKQNKPVSQQQMDEITPINRLIGEDPEQLQTVAAIVNLPPGSVPFVVFGPPGTGKTVTLVEAIRQILALKPDSRIIACAPSNSAADLLATKLAVLGPSQVLRLNSLTRPFRDLPEHLKKYSLINDNDVFAMPSGADMIKKYRVIVATCLTAGVPASLGVERGFFSHIFVDECGQATEPAVMVPLKGLVGEQTNLIVAGDNKQLGPVVHSALAAKFGLKTSYLARIMERDIYDLGEDNTKQRGGGGKGVTIIKLVRNFRSHPAILDFANEHFYNRELRYFGNPALTHSLENASELPTKRFPVIFHGIEGKDMREAESPSFFNIEEANLVKKYVVSLIGDKKNKIKPEHIGIITPYHAQRLKIMNLLHRERDPKLRDIRVGSVEEFQGQERRIIIISSVRSNTNFIAADIRRTLGFVANPHRFNVAITRAQALLVVIGNPLVLGLDPLWRAFLNYVHVKGGWRGKPPGWNTCEDVDTSESSYEEVENQFVAAARRAAIGKAEEELARLKALISRNNDGMLGIEGALDELDIDDDFAGNGDDDDEIVGRFGFGEGMVFREED